MTFQDEISFSESSLVHISAVGGGQSPEQEDGNKAGNELNRSKPSNGNAVDFCAERECVRTKWRRISRVDFQTTAGRVDNFMSLRGFANSTAPLKLKRMGRN